MTSSAPTIVSAHPQVPDPDKLDGNAVDPQKQFPGESEDPGDAHAYNESGVSGKVANEGAGKVYDVSGGSGRDSKGSAALSCRDRWSPFAQLKSTALLGDAADAEEFKFGEPIERVAFGYFLLQKIGQWPLMMFRTLMLSIGPIIIISILASLPCYGDSSQTALTSAVHGGLSVLCGLITITTPLLMTLHRQKLSVAIWSFCTFGFLAAFSAVVQLQLFKSGKTYKGLVAQVLLLPTGFIMAIATGKANTQPGWKPKWNTCCNVFGGISKASGGVAFASFLAFASGLMLIRFIREDTLTLAESKSRAMIVVRPTVFFVVKKLVYHAFAGFSRVRHPVLTKASNIGASVMLGVATSILFANTRTWSDIGFFIAGNWFTFGSKLWTFFGSKGSTQFRVLQAYSWFMSTGKPHVSPGMSKPHLRGFEIQAQNFGTTFGLVVIIAFYPVATIVYGDQSMIFKLLYATDMSTTFLLVALTNEIIEDNMGQLMIMRLTNCDFSKLYSFIPSLEVLLGLLMNMVFASVIVSSGWLFRAQKVGPFKEA